METVSNLIGSPLGAMEPPPTAASQADAVVKRLRPSGISGEAVTAILAVAVVVSLFTTPLLAQPGTFFPEPFLVEHQLVHDDGDGNRFVGEPVVDTYGGSWIVSQRPDGSRLIVDLARRELTEVRPAAGTYWTTSFDRFAELQERLRAVGGGGRGLEEKAAETSDGSSRRATTSGRAPSGVEEWAVTEIDVLGLPPGGSGTTAVVQEANMASRHWRRLRVTVGGPAEGAARATTTAPAGDALDAWVDPQIRLRAETVTALEALDATFGAPSGDERPTAATRPQAFVAAARAHAGGALVVGTSRPAGLTSVGTPLGRIEDVPLRVERLERFPSSLVEVPEGLRRVPHPLEATVRFLEEEAERNAVMSGLEQGANQ